MSLTQARDSKYVIWSGPRARAKARKWSLILQTLPEKNTWNKHFHEYLHGLDAKKPVIWTGDLNVAPKAIDLANPKTNWNKTPGYTEDETSAFERVLNPPEDGANKMVDVWRHLHPETQHYTYFSYRFNCRMKGIGWRLDHCESPCAASRTPY